MTVRWRIALDQVRNADLAHEGCSFFPCAQTILSGVGLAETARAAADISFK
ncbi:hypothetical protein [Trebonia kvetii]|uniref:hypothetical protein n=1 Tax=Trebonia kvetii TaxID=2480626 RepID=UPI00165240ED|nr:hypothetical protein [Trebonia kvetii]